MEKKIRKVLVANRGEIAIRAFRAAYEMGIATVAVYAYEDRNSPHRLKADESYQIGEPGHPVRAYLDVDGIIHAALEAEADAIYPGYGFLSENPDLAQACEEHGITFVGPDHTILELTGDKAAAIAAARAAGLPTLKGSDPSDDPDTLIAAAEEIGFPVFVKAVAGGGGRGMRRVDAPTRTDIGLVGWDERRQMVKVNPIAAWDDDDVDRFAFEEDVFLNPLREKGYPSIGCAPCTRPVAPGEDARAGRWAGKNKTECGLHT